MRVFIAFATLVVGLALARESVAQPVFEPPGASVYGFLEEMAAEGAISLNTFSKPLTRREIAKALRTLDTARDSLTPRQREALTFYMRDYVKEYRVGKDWDRRLDLFYHSDSNFRITVNPIVGGTAWVNGDENLHTRIGAEFHGAAGGFGFYGSLRDNTVGEARALPNHLTPAPGQNYKHMTESDRNDYNEAMGGLGYGWAWGDVSIVKDRLVWGNAERSANIFSAKAPSFASLYLRVYPTDWLHFQYMHGWLVSEVLDSARTYLTPHGHRRQYTNKNIAANALTIRTNWKVDFTLGNSIVYSDNGLEPVYFIPFLFYKSVDHTYSGTGSNELGQNSQMYFDVAVRSISGFKFFSTLYIDEISLGNFWDGEKHTNIVSLQVGATAYNLIDDIHLSGQYTRTAPWTYRHQIPSTTFASNSYGLGNYLGENAEELFAAIIWTPKAKLRFELSAVRASKGPPHEYAIVHGNANVTGLKTLESVAWRQTEGAVSAHWEPINGAVVFGEVRYTRIEGEESWSPEGEGLSFGGGFRIGF